MYYPPFDNGNMDPESYLGTRHTNMEVNEYFDALPPYDDGNMDAGSYLGGGGQFSDLNPLTPDINATAGVDITNPAPRQRMFQPTPARVSTAAPPPVTARVASSFSAPAALARNVAVSARQATPVTRKQATKQLKQKPKITKFSSHPARR